MASSLLCTHHVAMAKKTETRSTTAHIAPFGLRMQPDLRAKLEDAASASGRSLNAEIVARLEASFEAATTSPEYEHALSKAMTLAQALDAYYAELGKIQRLKEPTAQQVERAHELRALIDELRVRRGMALAEAEASIRRSPFTTSVRAKDPKSGRTTTIVVTSKK